MAHEHMADLLDLDAEVLSEYHREVAEWVSANLTERARVIDVGAGTGTGTLTLARQLPDAEVIALDVDEEMLKHIQDKARAGSPMWCSELAAHTRSAVFRPSGHA